jgi:hypothetical protein
MRAGATIFLAAAIVVCGCGGQTTGVTNVTAYSADLHATAHCDQGESCIWYWEYWPAGGPRSASTKTAVQGPVTGPTQDVSLSQHIGGLRPDTAYRWVFCGSPSKGSSGTTACVGPNGHPFSTTADPPPDSATFTPHAATWTIQPTPNPPGGTKVQLAAVSCASSTTCMAVGSYTNSANVSVTLAESWDGTSWTIRSTPNPTGGTGTELSGVSCTSSTACTAVGSFTDSTGKTSTLAERWNGTQWAIQTSPNPSGAAQAELNAVSCASSTACIAVGTGSSGSLAEHWDGVHWTIQPSHGDSLNGVSCTSATACTAVGVNANNTLAERWNGTTWAIQSTPTVDSYNVVSAVSCASATRCTAVGDYLYPGPRLHPYPHFSFAQAWDGSAWTDESMQHPTGDDVPQGVSCTSAAACAAVGFSADYYYANSALAQHWDGSAWTTQNTPSANGAVLSGVSCTSETACTAVGSYIDGGGQQATLAERYSG